VPDRHGNKARREDKCDDERKGVEFVIKTEWYVKLGRRKGKSVVKRK
jgi:hypothetical protein